MPGCEIRLELAVAKSWPLKKLVESTIPFHSTTLPLAKLLPSTVRVKLAVPAITEVGAVEVIAGVAPGVRTRIRAFALSEM